MSRFTLLLVGSALLLIVAACDTDDNDDGVNGPVDDTTELPGEEDEPEDTDVVVPEDDDDPVGTEPADDDPVAQDDQATQPADDEVTEPEDGEAMDPEAMQPGPEEGYFFDLTFDEANDLTLFELREPEMIPEGVQLQTIMAMASPQAPEEERGEEATTVTFSFVQEPEDEMSEPRPLELTQTTEVDMAEGLPPEADQEQITIGDREVTRVQITADTGEEIIAFMWGQDEVYFSLAAILGENVQVSDLEDMVASIPTS